MHIRSRGLSREKPLPALVLILSEDILFSQSLESGSLPCEMELTRSRGHADPLGRSMNDATDKASVSAGVATADRGSGRAGRTAASLAREFEPTETCIRNWIAQADRDAGLRNDGLTTEERKELNQLRRENRVLREERNILKKAAAWFAQETGATPRRSSPT